MGMDLRIWSFPRRSKNYWHELAAARVLPVSLSAVSLVISSLEQIEQPFLLHSKIMYMNVIECKRVVVLGGEKKCCFQ